MEEIFWFWWPLWPHATLPTPPCCHVLTVKTGVNWDDNSGWESNVSPGQFPHWLHSQQTTCVLLKYLFCSLFMPVTNHSILVKKKKKNSPVFQKVSHLHFHDYDTGIKSYTYTVCHFCALSECLFNTWHFHTAQTRLVLIIIKLLNTWSYFHLTEKTAYRSLFCRLFPSTHISCFPAYRDEVFENTESEGGPFLCLLRCPFFTTLLGHTRSTHPQNVVLMCRCVRPIAWDDRQRSYHQDKRGADGRKTAQFFSGGWGWGFLFFLASLTLQLTNMKQHHPHILAFQSMAKTT